MEHHKCVIIGSGPAGYTAAIYAARAGMKPLLFTGKEPGGQLMITNDVENFPGYPDGINGPMMMEDLRKQAERFETEIRYEMIVKANFSGGKKGVPHRLTTENGIELSADSIIISTGATAKWLGIEGEERLSNKGVSACAVCDGFFYRGQSVAVVGGGDSAAEEATYLAKLCPTVHLFVRRGEMRASKIMQQRVLQTPNLIVHWNSAPVEVLGKDEVEGVRYKNTVTGELSEVAIKGFFVAIGHKPNTDIFKVKAGASKTKIAGVFVAGDAADKVYRQAITAAGTGCMAALDAERWLISKGIG
jgi:thioredoxin reductase (NADPH)